MDSFSKGMLLMACASLTFIGSIVVFEHAPFPAVILFALSVMLAYNGITLIFKR